MAQAFVFKLGSLDLSDYVRVGPQDGLDPYGQGWLDPQFSDGPFAEGQPLLNIDAKNREMAWPLFLKDASKDALNALKVAINREIANTRPLMVEWRDSGSTQSTFYDVAYARLDEKFNYRLSEHDYSDVGLRVWCQPPYGHTGTMRVIGTAIASHPLLSIPIADIDGDVPALAQYQITSNQLRTEVTFAAVSVHQSASYRVYFSSASYASPGAPATLISASNVPDGKYVSIPLTASSVSLVDIGVLSVPLPSVYAGENRVLVICRTTGTAGWALRRYWPQPGPTAVATSGRWAPLDLGVVTVDPDGNIPSSAITRITAGPLGSPVASSSDALHIAGFAMVPEDRTTAVLATGIPMFETQGPIVLKGQLDKSFRRATVGFLIDDHRRGAIPQIMPGDQMVTALTLTAAGASSAAQELGSQQSAVVSARERFTFAR